MQIEFLVSPEIAADFESLLKQEIARLPGHNESFTPRVKRLAVGGQSFDPALADLTAIIVALGGGVGLASILKAVGHAIPEFIKSRRGTVIIKNKRGESISLKNYTADQVTEILRRYEEGGS